MQRAPLAGFVERQAALASREEIHVSEELVRAAPNASEIKRALRRLKQRVDAIWVLNDDRLLTPRLIADAWLPSLNDRPFRPTIVGAGSGVARAIVWNVCRFAGSHRARVQIAGLLFDIAGNDWAVPEGSDVQVPLSTTITVDLVQVRERFSLQRNALEQVDRILE